MTLYKKLQDLNSEINRLNKAINLEFISAVMTDNLLDAICLVLENEYFSNYYVNKFKNSKIELFSIKDTKLDVSIESKFLIEVYKIMYKKDEICPREFLQFINPSSYENREKWVVVCKPFEYWSLNVYNNDSKLTAYIYIDHNIISETLSDLVDEELVPMMYNFRELKFPKKNHAQIVALLDGVKGKILTDQAEQYQELCAIFASK